MIANVYIDGFNLYYGIKRWPYCKWLDPGALAHHLFPSDTINRIRYFAAHVKGKHNPGAHDRQQAYLRALKSVPNLETHFGRFLVTEEWKPLVNPTSTERFAYVIETEEKGSDVNLASHLLLDAFRAECNMAVVISNDSDLYEPIRLVQDQFGVDVWVINPHPKPTMMGSRRQLDLKKSAVAACQFPQEVILPNGKRVRCPTEWSAPVSIGSAKGAKGA
jgi:hypothetical protein